MSRRGYDDEEDDVAPWLAAAEVAPEARHTHVRKSRLIWWLGVLAVLLIVAVALIYAMVARPDDGGYAGPDGEVPLIAAPDGPYKVRPPKAGGMNVEGLGQASYAAADGVDPGGDLDLSALPEEPMARPVAGVPVARPVVTPPAGPPRTILPPTGPIPAAKPPAPVAAAAPPPAPKVAQADPKPKPTPAPAKPKGDKLADLDASLAAAAKPVAKPAAAPASGGSGTALQLGAFSSEAKAKAAWKNFIGRYGYLAGLEQAISPLARDGATLYRLRATGAGSHAAAADLCARLKVAGEQCSVTE